MVDLTKVEAREERARMSDAGIQQWIDACNHEPARQVLREYLALRTTEGMEWKPEREVVARIVEARGVLTSHALRAADEILSLPGITAERDALRARLDGVEAAAREYKRQRDNLEAAARDRMADWERDKARADTAEARAASLAARVKELEEGLAELIRACEAEVNEKGAGGFVLARLSDARALLAKPHPATEPPPDDDLADAISDAIADGEGRITPALLTHHLRKHGLEIVVRRRGEGGGS